MRPRVTISMPCFGRPERTRRSIRCILNQTIDEWEAIIIGDNCQHFEVIMKEGLLSDERIFSTNFWRNYGGCGYHATNQAILHASGEYFLFFANDDCISPAHMQTYLREIEGTDFDFMYFDYLNFGKLFKTKIEYAKIGHSALIIRTEFLKKMPLHRPDYGHDFALIENMVKAGAKYAKGGPIIPTYYVMSGNKHRIDPEGID